jgi:hypothetical protein
MGHPAFTGRAPANAGLTLRPPLAGPLFKRSVLFNSLGRSLVVQSRATSVGAYLAELPDDRRQAIEAVRAVIHQNLDKGFEEGMLYGMIGYYVPHSLYPPGYHCDPQKPLMFAALASQKNYMSLYLMCVYGDPQQLKSFQAAWAKSGRKLDMGKSCIRFAKLDDLALDAIADAIGRVSAKGYIEAYERVLNDRPKRTPKKSKAAQATPKKTVARKPKKSAAPAAKSKRKTTAK